MLEILLAAFRSPLNTGAVCASSRYLSAAMAASFDWINVAQAHPLKVLEIGTGTGVVTKAILNFCPEGVEFISIDNNKKMVNETTRRFPTNLAIVHHDAFDICSLKRENMEAFDVIFCTLPLTL